MRQFHIRRFSGIETRHDEHDQDRGTLRRADGILVSPAGTLSKGPSWRRAWGSDGIGAQIASALSGTAPGVHFVSITKGGCILLAAYDTSIGLACGVWHISGGLDGDSAGAATIGVLDDGSNMTPGLSWFGFRVGPRLIFGNGKDPNLIYADGILRPLGPQFHASTVDNPAKHEFPPCKAFAVDLDGRIYAAGNADQPLRVWISEAPRAGYPFIEGYRDDGRSCVDLLSGAGESISALSNVGGRILAHTDRGVVAITVGYDTATGYSADQYPVAVEVGAISPACVHDGKGTGYFLGADNEVYEATAPAGRDRTLRESRVVTNRSAGDWNKQASTGAHQFTILDERSARLWVNLPLTSGTNALYCYDIRSFAITGPFMFPDLTCAARVEPLPVRGVPVVGFTRGGALLWTDLSLVGAESYSPAGTLSGLCAAGVTSGGDVLQRIDATVFKLTREGWEASALQADWIDGATVSVVDLGTEDFGSPTGLKDFLEVRLRAAPGARFRYLLEVDDGTEIAMTPLSSIVTERQICEAIAASGEGLKLRLIIITDASPAALSSISLGFLPSATA